MPPNARPRRVIQVAARTGYASRSEAEDFAHDLKESFLLCRELGHNWKPWVARWVAEQRAYERALRCTRCRCERWQILSSSGEVLSSHYKYPEGYMVQGLGRIVGDGRDALRLESLTRALAHSKQEAS